MTSLELSLPGSLVDRLKAALKPIDGRDCTVAFAESCTGGLAAAAVSDIEGLGHVLECSFVTYSDEAKTQLLGLPADLIARQGAVAGPVARRMAQEALTRSNADIALSVTGFAGPAGPDDEEGLCYFALARTGRPTEVVERRFGPIGRGPVRLACLETLVDLLERAGAEP